MTPPNLSHYYISKKALLVSRSFGRLVLAVWSLADWQNFERLVMVFLKYKNGSNLERSFQSTIQCYVANPSKMKNFLIRLIITFDISQSNCSNLGNQFLRNQLTGDSALNNTKLLKNISNILTYKFRQKNKIS